MDTIENESEKIELMITIWNEIESLSKKNPFLFEKFKEINTLLFSGIMSVVFKDVISKRLEPIDTRFIDIPRVYGGYATANQIIGNIEKNETSLDLVTKMNMLGNVLSKLKETQMDEILSLLERYKGNKLDEYFLYPNYPIDGKQIINISDFQNINRINIKRIRNGFAHSRIKIDENTIEITDVNQRNSRDVYKIKMTHEMFRYIVYYLYFEIGIICALNDLLNLIVYSKIQFGRFLDKILTHLRKKGYAVPRPHWDADELS